MPDRDSTKTARPPARRPSFTRLPRAAALPTGTSLSDSGVTDLGSEMDWRAPVSATVRPARRTAVTDPQIPSVRGAR